jgi:ENTS family enterobactin (siderophore) exporter
MAAYTALMFTVYDRTQSSIWLSATMLAFFAGWGLLATAGGVIADRFDRRKVMIWSDVAAAGGYVALAFADAPLAFVLLTFLAAAAETPFIVASSAAIPNIVPPERVSWANSMVVLGRNIGVLAGPLIGGAVVAAGEPSWVFAGNAVTFLLSALLVWSIRGIDFNEAREEHSTRGLRAGIDYLLSDRVLRRLFIAWLIIFAGSGAVIVAEVPLAESFDVGAFGYALIIAAWGGGSIVGTVAARWLSERTEAAALVGALVVIGAGIGLVAITPVFVPVLLGMLVGGSGEGLVSVAEQSVVQRRTPDAVRSRVFAALEGAANLALAASFVGAGFLLDALGAQLVYGICAAVHVFAALILLPVLKAERLAPVAVSSSAEGSSAASSSPMPGPAPGVEPPAAVGRRE